MSITRTLIVFDGSTPVITTVDDKEVGAIADLLLRQPLQSATLTYKTHQVIFTK
jgi:hypothetical protein